MTSPVRICCVIPSHIEHPLRLELLRACVASVAPGCDEVIISMSGSTLNIPHATLILHQPARLRQFEHIARALEHTTADFILLMDDDDLASPHLLHRLRECLATADGGTRSLVCNRWRDNTWLQRDPRQTFGQLVGASPSKEASQDKDRIRSSLDLPSQALAPPSPPLASSIFNTATIPCLSTT